MSVGDHLDELRRHVLRALGYLVVAVVICLNFQKPILEVATYPHRRTMEGIAEQRLWRSSEDHLDARDRAAYATLLAGQRRLGKLGAELSRNDELLWSRTETDSGRELAELALRQQGMSRLLEDLSARQRAQLAASAAPAEVLGLRADVQSALKSLAELEQRSSRVERLLDTESLEAPVKVRLQQLRYPEAFMSYLKAAFVVALFVAAPFISWELWKFVAVGLYAHERRWVNVIGPLSFLIFMGGAAFGYSVLIPYGLHYLATYGGVEVIEGSITLSDYLSIFTTLTLVVGVVFQLPLVMSFTTLIGVMDHKRFRTYRRYFLLGAVVLAALLTPPDPVTQLLMAGPLLLLYELGVWLSYLIGRRRSAQAVTPTATERPPAERDERSHSVEPGRTEARSGAVESDLGAGPGDAGAPSAVEPDLEACAEDAEACPEDAEPWEASEPCPEDAEGCPEDAEGCPEDAEGCPEDAEGCPEDAEGCPEDAALGPDSLEPSPDAIEPGSTGVEACSNGEAMGADDVEPGPAETTEARPQEAREELRAEGERGERGPEAPAADPGPEDGLD